MAAGLALVLAGCEPEATQPKAPRPVRTLLVQPADAKETVSQTGEIQPRFETDVSFQVNGRITRRTVDLGARVKVGDELARIDDADIANEVRAAEADLASAAASARAAHAALERQRTLLEKQIIAQASFDAAEAQWRSAAAREDAASATLANARNKLNYTRLVAAGPGVVTAVGANAGQVVSAGQMVVRIATEGAKDAVFDVSERLVGDVSRDMPVRVSLLSDPAVAVKGQVREISPAADATTRTYRVRVTLPDAPEAMSFGATVNGSVDYSTGALIAIPASAISAARSAPAVFVVDRARNRLVLKPVVVERYTDSAAVIRSGLSAGDLVVVAGVSKLRPDEAVSLEEGAR